MPRIFRTLTLLAVVLALGAALWAHGKHEQLMGTVQEITENAITVETTKKEARTIAYDSKTKFEKSGAPASVTELKVGERVVIDVHTVNKKPHAALVRFGPPRRAA